ncbi:MAG: GAF domain-containing protein, partial [Acidobacteria bacterium]
APESAAALEARVRDLERLLEINRSLNSARAPHDVLAVLLDTAVDLSGAERGFVLLEKAGRPEVELARGAGGTELAGDEREASRDVARRVMAGGAPLRTLDAAGDARLRDSRSVHALRIRSVLAVPIRVRGETAGALVLDSRHAAVGFDERAEELVVQLADQAGIALANASLIDELERQAEEIRRLNLQLAEEVEQQRVELLEKQSNLELRYRFDSLVGASGPMQRLYRALDKLIPTEIPVLITGESGTGKDLVARVLHYNGPRREQRFVTVNCAALTDTLLESELFGHRRGAFTGADRDRGGLFEQADGGTLFLDEIGEMPLHLQPKLLRAIQFGEVRRVGEDAPRHVDVRIVAATNRDLRALVAERRFREDLYYRLDVGRVHLAPLRERLEDLGLLVDHFLEQIAAREGRETPLRIEPAALRLFTRHDWPGNVRELENEIVRLAAFCDGPLITEVDVLENTAFAEKVAGGGDRAAAGAEPGPEAGTLERLEIERIREALREAGGNRTRAARILGIDRSTLYRKLKRLGEA